MTAGFDVEWTETAERDLRRLDEQTRRRVLQALERLTGVPPVGDARHLRVSTDEWRLRVGDWRVRFELDEQAALIRIQRVLHRSKAYRD